MFVSMVMKNIMLIIKMSRITCVSSPLQSSSTFLSAHLISYSTDPQRFLLPSFLARSSQIKGLILELRHKSINHRITDPDEVAHIDAEISRWWNDVQDFIDPSLLDEDDIHPSLPKTLRSCHRILLMVQKHESVILLNRPVITSGHNTFAVDAAMQKCIGASKAIISTLYQHLQDCKREDKSPEGRISSPLFWPGFTWCVWMSGLVLLYAASNGFYSVEAAQRYEHHHLSSYFATTHRVQRNDPLRQDPRKPHIERNHLAGSMFSCYQRSTKGFEAEI